MSQRVNIEAERARLLMGKGEMCQALGVTLKTYNAYIRGGPIPSTILEKLKAITGCSVDYLLDLDVKMPDLMPAKAEANTIPIRSGSGAQIGHNPARQKQAARSGGRKE